jgi:hypothetical protein
MVQRTENVQHLQRGLTEEDFEPVLNAEHFESVYNPMEMGFPRSARLPYHLRLRGRSSFCGS